MTRREKEILQLKREISTLNQKLENLEKLNEESIDLDEALINFSDFPWSCAMQSAYCRLKLNTVFDLINTTPEKLLSINGFGISKLKKVEEWMTKHGITFLTAE